MSINFKRVNYVDELNGNDPMSSQMGMGTLLEELIAAVNNHVNRVFTVFPEWKAWQLPYNVIANSVYSCTTAHTPVISSVIHKINTATTFMLSSNFKGSASFLANVATASISSSSAAPLARAANSSAALTITTGDMPAAIGPAVTSYSSAMTAINSAVTLQNQAILDVATRINLIGSHFSSASNQYTVGGVVISAGWSSLSTPVTATIATSGMLNPLDTAVTTVSTSFSDVMGMVTAQASLTAAMQRLNAVINAAYLVLNSATYRTNQIATFLTAAAHENSATASASFGICTANVASSAAVPFSVASVTTAISAITALTQVVSLATRSEG